MPIPAQLRPFTERPAFAIAAIGIVALGVALATTAASVVDALVFRPIPVPDVPQVHRVDSGVFSGAATPPDARDVIERLDVPAFGYSHRFSAEYAQGKRSGLITMCELQGDAFEVLQWLPAQGRLLQPQDYLRGSEPVAVLSHYFWVNDFASQPDILGQSIQLNGKPFRIVGILPPESNRIHRTIKPHVWTALVHTFGHWIYDNRNFHNQTILARIGQPNTLASYQTELDRLNDEIRRAYPDTSSNVALHALPEGEASRGNTNEAVQQSYIIIGLVTALLLTACFNVGNMLLANAYRREREFAIRRSVGASATQIARQLLSESMSIALVGGVLGTALAAWLVTLADQLPFTRWVDVQLDRNALAFALLATLATGLISGLAPTLHLARGNPGDAIKQGAKGSHVALAPRVLVVAQIALSTVLLTATVLYTLSIRASLSLDLGYDPSKIAFFDLSLQSIEEGRREQVAQNLRDELGSLPGVASVAFSSNRPLNRYGWTHLKTDRFHPDQEEDKCFAGFAFISRGYLDTLGVPLLEGRDVYDSEAGWRPLRVALVNQAFVKRFFPDGKAVGQEFWPWGTGEDRARIVGVFGDFSGQPWTDAQPLFLFAQSEPRNTMLVRAEGDPRSILSSIQSIVHDPKNEYVAQQVLFFSDAQARAFSNERSALYVLSVLAASALLLSSVGVWYTTRQYVRQNRKELSIRLAIGATPNALLNFILRRSLLLVFVGLVLGFALSYASAYWIQRSIHGISPQQATPYLLTCAALLGVAFFASYFPARSASSADPCESLLEV